MSGRCIIPKKNPKLSLVFRANCCNAFKRPDFHKLPWLLSKKKVNATRQWRCPSKFSKASSIAHKTPNDLADFLLLMAGPPELVAQVVPSPNRNNGSRRHTGQEIIYQKLEQTKNKKCFGVNLTDGFLRFFLLFGFPFPRSFPTKMPQVLCFSDATQHQQLWGSNCTWAILIQPEDE